MAGQGASVHVWHVDGLGSGLVLLGPDSGCSPGMGHLWLRAAPGDANAECPEVIAGKAWPPCFSAD